MSLHHSLIKLSGTLLIVVLLSLKPDISPAQAGEPMSTIEWYSDLNEAKQQAVTAGKYVMLYFSGSEWSKSCNELNKNILDTETFSRYAKGNFVPVKLEFPRIRKNTLSKKRGMDNKNLVEKYNPNGVFPLLVFLDENDKMIGFTGYNDISPTAYVTIIDNIIK